MVALTRCCVPAGSAPDRSHWLRTRHASGQRSMKCWPGAASATRRSARSIAACAAAMASRSMASPVSWMPGASSTMQVSPCSAMRADTKSRVVPAIGEAAATVLPASALSSELLPAFGGPMMATVGASIRRCRRRERSASPGPGAPCVRQRSGCASSRGMARSLAARGSVVSMRRATGSALAVFHRASDSAKRAPRASRRSVHNCRRRGPPCGVTSRVRSSTRSSSASSRPGA